MTNQTIDSADLLNEILMTPSNEIINDRFNPANTTPALGSGCAGGCSGFCGGLCKG